MNVVNFKQALPQWSVGIAGGTGPFVWDIQTIVLATDLKDAAKMAQQKADEANGLVYSLTRMELRLVDEIPPDAEVVDLGEAFS